MGKYVICGFGCKRGEWWNNMLFSSVVGPFWNFVVL